MLVSILFKNKAASINKQLEKAQKAEYVTYLKSFKNKGESSKKNLNLKDLELNKGFRENDYYKRKERFKNRNRNSNSSSNLSRNSNSSSSSKPTRTFPGTSFIKDITYYTCKQKGHYSSNTKCLKYNE